MKILHFILGKANPDRANGVNHVIHGLCKYSSNLGHEVKVIGVSRGMDNRYERVQREGFYVDVYNSLWGECFSMFKEYAKDADIVHFHSVWQNYNLVLANYLIMIDKPYVVTTHSGLTDDRIKQSNYYLKLAYHRLFQKRIFDKAAGIQAITREEMNDISKLTNNSNIFFTQNGIDLDKVKLLKNKQFIKRGKIYFGYLGRMAQEKNIRGLILAIAELPHHVQKSIECHLIGPIDNDAKALMCLVKSLELSGCVKFLGPKYGTEKFEALNNLDFYIHPAFSDVVSIAVKEAMACGLPSLITRTSQVSYYYNSGAFLMMEPLAKDIKHTILKMLSISTVWPCMSDASVELVKKVFNWQDASNVLISEYEKILDEKLVGSV